MNLNFRYASRLISLLLILYLFLQQVVWSRGCQLLMFEACFIKFFNRFLSYFRPTVSCETSFLTISHEIKREFQREIKREFQLMVSRGKLYPVLGHLLDDRITVSHGDPNRNTDRRLTGGLRSVFPFVPSVSHFSFLGSFLSLSSQCLRHVFETFSV